MHPRALFDNQSDSQDEGQSGCAAMMIKSLVTCLIASRARHNPVLTPRKRTHFRPKIQQPRSYSATSADATAVNRFTTHPPSPASRLPSYLMLDSQMSVRRKEQKEMINEMRGDWVVSDLFSDYSDSNKMRQVCVESLFGQ